ncbi:Transforming acidic coiled-coil-containing protein 2 [Cichlidogyrus casuarinus]|uniref:Transforming acidic coiled-coil-containing protein 2 n=1 Tax=Cichlidogyrus casuarinus TaxID=1844966 RepID=A0ABD2Q920_9PLAT
MSENDPSSNKGGYQINWDEIDENTNPFATKSKILPVPDQTVSGSYDFDASENGDVPEMDLKTPMQMNNNQPQFNDLNSSSAEPTVENISVLKGSYDLNQSQVITPRDKFALTESLSLPGVSVPVANNHCDEDKEKLQARIEELTFCILEYQRSLQYMLDQKEKVETKKNDPIAHIIAERDQTVKELATLEKAFTELCGRFDRAKYVIDTYKDNEIKLQASLQKMNEWLHRNESKTNLMQKNFEEEIHRMNEKCTQQKQCYESDLALVTANLKMSELKIKNLESDLASQKQTTAELTAICDDLLNRYNPQAD